MGIKDVFRKADIEDLLNDLGNILDPQDMEILVVREKGCEVLFSSARAASRMHTESRRDRSCKADYIKGMTGLCEGCPYGKKGSEAESDPYEVTDDVGRTFSVRSNSIEWIDDKPAAVLMLRDITPELEGRERLFNLAYIDQLTHVPNRQKLKEDFGALEEGIAENTLTGIIAIFDLDNFKEVNDTYGHNTGDVVLRRLTEHLQGEKTFADHIYRLGGDEFVFLFSTPAGTFASDEEMKTHYEGMLSTALRAYTLPNIHVKCTISMGVSFFPKHGSNLSDILRKADIALYKAKTGGRNRVVFFEDRYDTAQKFKDMYINIQPVLVDYGKTFGYELVDSGSDGHEDADTVSLNEFNRTLDALGLSDIENDRHYFIPYSGQLLDPAVLNHLPKDKFIVQMPFPARQLKHDVVNIILKFKELRKNGYKLALVGLNSAAHVQELLQLADYCKFSKSDLNVIRQKKIIDTYPKIKFIATGVDTPDAFRRAKESGFHMFQGFYFNQPVMGKKTKEVDPLKVNYLRLLKACSTTGYMDFRQISEIISADVALSYKLLRILNSAAVGLRNVSSIASAVAYMGEESLKKWIAVLALRGIAEKKPLELVRMSLIRARFGELLAPNFQIRRNPQQVFMAGMLSLLHIALEMTKEELLEEIPVSEEIRSSLLTKSGIYSELLRFYENYEYANWDAVSQFVDENQLEPTFVNDSYIASVKWYNDLAEA